MRVIRLLQTLAYAATFSISISQAVCSDDRERPDTAGIALACGGCHGASGQGMGSIPAINRMPESEFIRTMEEFQSGRRSATVMDRIARGYQHQDFVALARFFRNH